MFPLGSRLFGFLPLALMACGGAAASSDPPATGSKTESRAEPSDPFPAGPIKAPDKLERSALATILPTGLPWLLRRVWPEEVFREGKFAGWRVVAIPEEWTGLDIKPDDIVTRVNGKPVETPEQMWDAWTSLATAPELRISYERGGESRELVLPIVGPPAPELLASLNNPSPPPRKPSAKRGTIVIESRDPGGDPGDN